MASIQVFQCPSCGANVPYDGGPETSFPCQFCGTTLVVPEELRAPGASEQNQPQTAATPPAAPPPPAPPARKSASALSSVGSVGCSVLFCGGLVAFILVMVYTLNFSASYRQALDAARSDPSVIDALGAPVEASWWPATGEISCGDHCYADYNIPIHGSRKSGYIAVRSHSSGGAFNEGEWILNASVHVDGGGTFPLK